MDLSNMRINYSSNINLDKLKSEYQNPVDLFQLFFNQARNCKQIIEANTMFIATSSNDLISLRPVLLKEIKNNEFIFYTNYLSKKSQDLQKNKNIAAAFYWEPLQQCVRIEGQAYELNSQENDKYFQQRPRQSQLGAWSSIQSQEIDNREQLFKNYQDYDKKFENKEIPRPQFWGGWKIIPQKIEFWQGEQSRLHQRLEYHKNSQQLWQSKILSP